MSEIPQVPLSWLNTQLDADIVIPDLLTPNGKVMKGYQRVAAAAIVTNPRMILGDWIGMGKSLEFLAGVRWLKAAGRYHRGLLVAPAKLTYQWVDEAQEWFGGALRFEVVDGAAKRRHRRYAEIAAVQDHPFDRIDMLCINYAILRQDIDVLCEVFKPDLVAFDEASALRNADTAVHQAALRVVADAPRRIGITANPAQSHLEDYHSVLAVISPETLGSRERFESRYCSMKTIPITMKGGRQRFIRVLDYYRAIDFFLDEVKDVVLKRMPEDVGAQVPKVMIADRLLPLTPAQETRYNELADGILALEGRDEDTRLIAIERLVRLQQVCNDVSMVFPDEVGSSKMEDLEHLLTGELSKQQVVIFAYSLTFLRQRVEPLLKRLKLQAAWFTGDAGTAEEVNAGKRRFQAGEVPIAVMTTAGEEGLNLDAASVMICLEVLTNEARMQQVYGRIARASSTHTVATVIRLLSRDTIETRKLELLAQRSALLQYLDQDDRMRDMPIADVLALVNRKVNLLDRS